MDKGPVMACALEFAERVVEIRRQIHVRPELGFEETETAALVSRVLSEIGLEVTSGVAGTGVVGLLRGGRPGRTVGLRADMDALPITEDTGLAFASQIPGKMHACGHDGHVAMLLGAAMVLSRLRNDLEGNVKLIFQPSEERVGGAAPMIEAGVLENPHVDAIFAAHLWPDVPFGSVGVHYGPAMASLDEIEMEIRGRGGHVATPHKSVDAIVAAAFFISQLQSVVSRETDPTEPVVVGIGRIEGGTAYNAIADRVTMRGTVRVVNPELRKAMKDRIQERLCALDQALGTEHTFTYKFGYPPVVNNEQMADFVQKTAAGLFGEEKAVRLVRPSLVGEDVAYYLERVPGAIFLLGVGDGLICNHPLHHPGFAFNEDVLFSGVTLLSTIAMNYLSTKQVE